jgi:N6-adenosine-specific RNA methylase IME4
MSDTPQPADRQAPVVLAGRFGAVLADPPWPYATYSVKGTGRSAEAHYDTVSIDAICALPVRQSAVDDCVLFLWVTKPTLPRACEVITAWDFEYKTNGFWWAKTYPEPAGLFDRPPRFCIGLGHWTRANPEQCLLATRGHPQRQAKDVPEIIIAPRREHSRKPDEIYERIERLVAGPYLELFARDDGITRPGWTRWIGKAAATERRWKSDSYPAAPA